MHNNTSSLRILYLSCHSILEYDEVRLLNELGHYVFSPGAYINPKNPGDKSLRPGLLNVDYDVEDVLAFHALGRLAGDSREQLTKEFVDRFDIVIVMHIPQWITINWKAMKHKPVVWRTIGQSIAAQEFELRPYRKQGLNIIRYSPLERTIPGYIGEDALIRFYKDPEEFKNWSGEKKRVVTFAQSMQLRNQACNFSFFEEVTRPYNRGLYGPGNEESGSFAHAEQEFDVLKNIMRNSRVYFYTGTHPASYTLNFIEAWMTGIPIVAIGPKRGNASYFPGHNLYEVPSLIKNSITGFVSDDRAVLQKTIQKLLDNDELATSVSAAGREQAIRTFGKDVIAEKWRRYLETL
jgi:glycosyltransferase involved in cell wall biosynthesis